MQYRDVYKIIPQSYTWRYISPASVVMDRYTMPQYMKEDYKTPYKKSENYLRKLIPFPSPNVIGISKLSEQEAKWVNDLYKSLPGIKEAFTNAKVNEIPDIREGNMEENVRDLVRSTFAADALVKMQPGLKLAEYNTKVVDNYVVFTETVGMDKSLDVNEGNPLWETVYFETLQRFYDYDEHLKEDYDYKLPVYVGRTKKWQLISDYLGKDQVDKTQIAIGAPVQEQLDLWDEENSKRYIQMPINNANHSKFRDRPLHFERLNHDYDQIIFERQRNQQWEKQRNSRYWEYDNHNQSHSSGSH